MPVKKAARAATAAARPEHWSTDAGDRDVARLDIPPDALRERRFEIYCGFVVANKTGDAGASHGLRVLVNGALEWTRRVPTEAGTDSLDLRLRKTVPPGQPLRLTATTSVRGAQRVRLTITADEDPG